MLPLNTILTGDCLALLPALPDASIDFMLFSPPYNDVRHYQGGWTVDIGEVGQALYRVLKEGGVCAVVVGDSTKDFAKQLLPYRWVMTWCDTGQWRLFEQCVYARHGNPGAWWATRFRVDHEFILLFFKGARPAYFDRTHLDVPSKQAGRMYQMSDRHTDGTVRYKGVRQVKATKCRGTIWHYATSNSENNRLKSRHPATFPDALASDLIRSFCPPHGVVLDPMCGSGTTCVMAQANQRQFIGFDISPEYCDIARTLLAMPPVTMIAS